MYKEIGGGYDDRSITEYFQVNEDLLPIRNNNLMFLQVQFFTALHTDIVDHLSLNCNLSMEMARISAHDSENILGDLRMNGK